MKRKGNLYHHLCSYDNLESAYRKARKRKTRKSYVIEFERNLSDNILNLRSELIFHSYRPMPLVNFIVRDPKTRKISKSAFRDRVVHHALCNVIEPVFDKTFIHDSYANRTGKGTLKAIQRFDHFKRRASKNNACKCYVLKADIKKYFETIDHKILLKLLRKKIKDRNVIWLINIILTNGAGEAKKGMPLGNLTSQFFANVYLDELDRFVKHILKAKYYIRYVDDFVLLEKNKDTLEYYKKEIEKFLVQDLGAELHPDKSRIQSLGSSFTFLGFRIFYHHKLLRKSNLRKMRLALRQLKESYDEKKLDYDAIYDFFEGWVAHARHANTYKLRKNTVLAVGRMFPGNMSSKEFNRLANLSQIDNK